VQHGIADTVVKAMNKVAGTPHF